MKSGMVVSEGGWIVFVKIFFFVIKSWSIINLMKRICWIKMFVTVVYLD